MDSVERVLSNSIYEIFLPPSTSIKLLNYLIKNKSNRKLYFVLVILYFVSVDIQLCNFVRLWSNRLQWNGWLAHIRRWDRSYHMGMYVFNRRNQTSNYIYENKNKWVFESQNQSAIKKKLYSNIWWRIPPEYKLVNDFWPFICAGVSNYLVKQWIKHIFFYFKYFSRSNFRKSLNMKIFNLENGLDYLAVILFAVGIALRWIDEGQDVFKYARLTT